MSYADAAAKGPKQAPEENTESEAASLIDVDSPHISSVRSDYESQPVQTSTQADRLEREAEDRARKASARASEAATAAKEKARQQGKKAKDGAKESERKLDANKDNPVVIANGVILVVGTAAVGFGAYKKYTEGTLDWKVAGITAGVVGAFAVADYYASQWLFKNKYPPKD